MAGEERKVRRLNPLLRLKEENARRRVIQRLGEKDAFILSIIRRRSPLLTLREQGSVYAGHKKP